MRHMLTSMDWVRVLEDEFPLIRSEPTETIELKNASTGQRRFEQINKECWRDDVLRHGCELIWAKIGFEVVEELSHVAREGSGFSTAGFWIDDESGKVTDFASSKFTVNQ
jgi:hypothetical protein